MIILMMLILLLFLLIHSILLLITTTSLYLDWKPGGRVALLSTTATGSIIFVVVL